MFKLIHELLRNTDSHLTHELAVAKGLNKLPENWKDVKNHIKLAKYKK